MTTRDRFVWLLAAVLALLSVGANGCGPQPTPVPPTTLGGAPAAGGAPSFGGSDSGGSSSATDSAGGSGATGGTSTATVAIEWPECASKAKRVERTDVEKYRRTLMPARGKQIHRRARASYSVLSLPSVIWPSLTYALDQGDLGSCTGNAAVQIRVSRPWAWVGSLDPLELEKLAVSVYSDATRIDPFDGYYPPDDTGSDGNSVMSVMRKRGLITSWDSVITFEGLQRALQNGPCAMGSNWYSSMFTPDRCGQLELSGVVEGGHETGAVAIDYSTKRVLFRNSWSNDWGAKIRSTGFGGYFWLKFGDVQRLINEGADFVCPTVH